MSGLYIHIPFCLQKCRYCDFVSYTGHAMYMEAYLHALDTEIKQRAGEQNWGIFHTVFLGGGTPSLLSATQMETLLQTIHTHFQIAADAEITVECNPGTADVNKLAAYYRAGITRLSVGVQSTNDRILQAIGRIHTCEEAISCLHNARTAGFQNINADIMHGLPGQTELDYISAIQDISAANVTHISAYSLLLEEGTPLYAAVAEGDVTLPNEDDVAVMQDIGALYLAQRGYERYEISNYAKTDATCLHNLNYWNNGDYLGLGAAAHSAWRLQQGWVRFENPAALSAYIKTAAAPLFERTLIEIPPAEEAFESVMLGLRQVRGLPLAAFQTRFGICLEQLYPHAVSKLTESGSLIIENGYARLSKRGLDLQNTMLQYFLDEPHK